MTPLLRKTLLSLATIANLLELSKKKPKNLLKISRKVTESLWAKKALQTKDERRVIPELPTMEEQLKAMEEAKQMK